LEYSEKVARRVKTPRFPRGFAKAALEIARQSGVHSREAGGALADGKTAINGLFSRCVRACSARFATFSGIPLLITKKSQTSRSLAAWLQEKTVSCLRKMPWRANSP